MYQDKLVTAIITAGGKGLRMGMDIPKQLLLLGGKTILERAAEPFIASPHVDRVIITAPEEWIDEVKTLFPGITVLAGGSERQDSVSRALREMDSPDDGLVLIHDGVRPYCNQEIIERVLEAAYATGAAVCAIPSVDTLRHVDDGTLDRSKILRVQTPQGFKAGVLREAYENASKEGLKGTDDAGLVEALGHTISIVEGSEDNIKITTKGDLPMESRIGMGFDVHAFSPDRKLILCGVEIPHDQGLMGHSDADVAVHALMDALLGAAGLPDIGNLFPDTDPAYKGADSTKLLEEVMRRLAADGYSVSNVDITIICQKPKLAPHIQAMKERLGQVMGLDIPRIGIKATTSEHLGFTGREEGIASQAICLLTK